MSLPPPSSDLRRELDAVRAFSTPGPVKPLPTVTRIVVERLLVMLMIVEVMSIAFYLIWKFVLRA